MKKVCFSIILLIVAFLCKRNLLLFLVQKVMANTLLAGVMDEC